ncbi:hypothetical protein KKA95_02055 [Patescibacteria group bacterium]|nr:hypothetical protein [Patescibacteria group bacterium]
MSNKSHFIAQIKEEEDKAADMLKKVEDENNKRVIKATEESEDTVRKMEDATRVIAQEKLEKAKEEAKEEYKKIIVEGDNSRRDTVEGGKTKLSKGQKHISEAFMEMFS